MRRKLRDFRFSGIDRFFRINRNFRIRVGFRINWNGSDRINIFVVALVGLFNIIIHIKIDRHCTAGNFQIRLQICKHSFFSGFYPASSHCQQRRFEDGVFRQESEDKRSCVTFPAINDSDFQTLSVISQPDGLERKIRTFINRIDRINRRGRFIGDARNRKRHGRFFSGELLVFCIDRTEIITRRKIRQNQGRTACTERVSRFRCGPLDNDFIIGRCRLIHSGRRPPDKRCLIL